MLVSVVYFVLAGLHGENYYVFVAEQSVRPKFDLSNAYLHSVFSSYSYLILGVLTIFVMLIACIMGIFYRMPDYDTSVISKMPIAIRALLSMFGGIMSMFYLIHTDGTISIKTALIAGLCAYITPATFHLIHAAFFKTVSIIVNLVSKIIVRRIVFLLTGVLVSENETNEDADNVGDRQDEP